ncbi:MAG: hypothetical protein GC190_20455 [Alphaproteobacteria bacterium]|nr:hypothetical protein [Alphaproteobacteria bacterium]
MSRTELTPRERDTLQLVAIGMNDAATGKSLGISPRTVRYHLDNAARKLKGRNRIHTVVLAMAGGIITPPTPVEETAPAEEQASC